MEIRGAPRSVQGGARSNIACAVQENKLGGRPMTEGQPVADPDMAGWDRKLPVDCAGETVAVDSGGPQATKSVMATRATAREVPETHPASRLYRVFTGLF